MKTVIAHSPEHKAIEYLGLDAPPHEPIAVDYGPKYTDSVIHEYRCGVCGHTNHCSVCRRGDSGSSWLPTHQATDDDGRFYTCQEPERYQAKIAVDKARFEAKERTELARLKAKYGD